MTYEPAPDAGDSGKSWGMRPSGALIHTVILPPEAKPGDEIIIRIDPVGGVTVFLNQDDKMSLL